MPSVELKGVSVEYPDAVPLRALDWSLGPGVFAVMGPSGSGKSTLLRVVAGLQSPDEGSVEIDGEPVVEASWRLAGDPRVALIHQDYRLVPFLTVSENLRLAAESRGVDVDESDISKVLERVALDRGMSSRLPGTMSGGEQQRVAIARSLVCGASLILADEPTGQLDAENTQNVADILVGLGGSAMTVVIATHDGAVADRIETTFLLGDGKLEVR